MTRRLKVLVEAYECSPGRGHVPGSAWRIVRRLSECHDIWVLTEARYEKEIRENMSPTEALNGSLNFLYIPRIERPGRAKGYHSSLPIGAMLRYRQWLMRSYEVASKLRGEISFDLVHHLRADTFREPGFLWKLGLPFVWGPMGGTGFLPWSMMPVLSFRGRVAHSVKNIVNAIQLRGSRRVIQALRHAHVLAQTCEDRDNLRKVHGVEACVVHEQSADPSLGFVRRFTGNDLLRLVWAGRCTERKGIPLLLRALQVPDLRNRVELHLAADGPKLQEWKLLADRLGIGDACVWHGWLSQKATLALLSECHVAAFPSLREATSTFVMQALSTGLPIVCLDHCGFGDVVDETCGFKIPVTNPGRVVSGLSHAFCTMIQNPEVVECLSKGAIERSRQYSWETTASLISKAYEDAVRCASYSDSGPRA
jgi:glycosyltransferase involved in cell wall biosynthesis